MKEEKEKVLVRDNRGVFLKMFRRKFKDEVEFSEDSFLLKNNSKSADFDRSIFVVYEKEELIEFLKLGKNGSNVMLCFFDKQLYNSLVFIEGLKNFFIIDASKTRREIVLDLKMYFTDKSENTINKGKLGSTFSTLAQSADFQKALFFMM
ncbi:hypothetical protein [Flavobacterium gelatinilyticum]|uniref:hypothetical protein n=1 Tax=Flavobacterium gelatinilyticum TaxID=3003260 RepID=UPI0024815623|nr:hypothetical protein [Flavobacterium gelatinilyticum]